MRYAFERRLAALSFAGVGMALALVFGLAAPGQCAPDTQTASIGEMSIEDLMNVTVVTGKKAESASKTPAAVFVITHEDIERYGYQTLTQALRRISGFYSETDRYISFIGLRGYLPNSDLNRRVLVLVDGHKVNDYMYGQAPVDQDLPLDMRDIERIEVVKGPGSALWGSEALLCVINCITKTASEMEGLDLRQDLGFREGQRLAYGHSRSGGLEVAVSANRDITDGQSRIYFPSYDTPENNNGKAVGLDRERVGRGFLDMSYKGYKFFYDQVSRFKVVPTAYWWCAFNAPDTDVTDKRTYWEMSWENQKPYASDGKLFIRTYNDMYDGILNWGNGPGEINTRNVDQAKAYGGEVRYSRSLASNVSTIMGLEYVQARGERYYLNVNPYRPRSYKVRHSSLLSYYMQTDWDIFDRLRFVAGTRLDDHDIFGRNWSPRAAFIYNQSAESTLKLLYGRALRLPSMSETGGDTNPNNLRAEKIDTYEFVWERQMGSRGRLVTSLFSFNMNDVIMMTPEWDTIMGKIMSKGIETQYDYRLRGGGSGYLGLSFVNADYDDPSRPFPSSPHLVGTCGLSIPVLGDKAFLSSDVQFVGSRKTLIGNTVGAAALANLALTSSTLVKNGYLTLGITNLFNTPVVAPAQQWNVTINDEYTDAIPQGERMLQFQVAYNL